VDVRKATERVWEGQWRRSAAGEFLEAKGVRVCVGYRDKGVVEGVGGERVSVLESG
jgi:hypothetical protein